MPIYEPGLEEMVLDQLAGRGSLDVLPSDLTGRCAASEIVFIAGWHRPPKGERRTRGI